MIVADGFTGNPLTNSSTINNYVSRTLDASNKFEIGDPYYSIQFGTTAFLFVIATAVNIFIITYIIIIVRSICHC
jgi:hypothetical protein